MAGAVPGRTEASAIAWSLYNCAFRVRTSAQGPQVVLDWHLLMELSSLQDRSN
jgi:hypothetical protein